MISAVESDKLPIATELPGKIFNRLHKVKDVFTQATGTLHETTQQAQTSVTETALEAVDRANALTQQTKDYLTIKSQNAVDVAHDTFKAIKTTAQQAQASVQETIEQTKGSVAQTMQTTGQIKTTTTAAVQSVVNDSISDWLQAHPTALRLVQMLVWATQHPILSLVIFLFTVAIAWSLIKAIGRLFDKFWLFILKVPLQLGQFLIRACSQLIGNFGSLTIKGFSGNKNTALPTIPASESVSQDKQQRLHKISIRLEEIRKEQNELLQEAVAIMDSDETAAKIFLDTPQQPKMLNINGSSTTHMEI